ncbi:UMP kinase [Candidatus Micrarchaeota archaeon]|nr:UMP kinase [Candidatus Micrarchaeota archaeon]
MKTIVISLGGSLLADEDYPGALAEVLLPLTKKYFFAIVCGGGEKARAYAQVARKETQSEFYADKAAIEATRENANFVKGSFGWQAYSKIALCPEEAVSYLNKKRVVFSGGFLPGITTDACAVLLAEALGATKVVNASKVDGVYDRNPSERGAKLFPKLKHQQLIELAAQFDERKARTNFVFDLVAAKLAARSKIRVEFVDGRDLKALKNAVEGKKHKGTIVG